MRARYARSCPYDFWIADVGFCGDDCIFLREGTATSLRTDYYRRSGELVGRCVLTDVSPPAAGCRCYPEGGLVPHCPEGVWESLCPKKKH